jgi:predicted dehydrogenase/threonine dehydrogenase-like Zn-dependent dehydrogenase
MEQLTQNLKNGEMKILEVPFPALMQGCVLVRNYFSVISAGTEGKSVKDARLGYIAKARSRKEEVRKVISSVKTYGLLPAYRMVMNKLDAPSPLGYCCAGEVIAVASDVTEFKTGDFVACGGNTAVHAEVVAVPVNLCVKIEKGIPLDQAAFTTIGAIALQGIRQSDLRLGENAVVIGLGLVGQLTIQMLNAAGIRTAGIDIDPAMVLLAKDSGCELALERNADGLENKINEFTNGHGTDAVIITAGTDSVDPVDLAGDLCRKKGKVIIVGAVPTGFKRTNYFKKELDLRMSSSYGPGRYDSEYEEQGIDYPYAYVRWTEKRNMEAFAELLKKKNINPGLLISHVFDFSKAADAYDLILGKTEPFTGILLKYDISRELKRTISFPQSSPDATGPAIAFIGAGSFGQNFLLPEVKGKGQLIAVATSRPHTAANIAVKYGFESCTGNAAEIFSNAKINTVFIVTRHDSHARYVLEALDSGKNVFVEKPLCLTLEELEAISRKYRTAGTRLMLGFNRRFAPFVTQVKENFIGHPVAINYRVNAGMVPADHWIHDPKTGGGRIIGEVCHFVDLCMHLASSPIVTVQAQLMEQPSQLQDTIIINLGFANGSIASISYFSNGSKDLSKEKIECFSSGTIAVIDDFKKINWYGSRNSSSSAPQDKGHAEEVRLFLDAVRHGKPSPVSFDEIYLSTLATFKVLESIATKGQLIQISGH